MKYEPKPTGQTALHAGKKIQLICARTDNPFGVGWDYQGCRYLMVVVDPSPKWILADAKFLVTLPDIELHEDFNTAVTMALMIAEPR